MLALLERLQFKDHFIRLLIKSQVLMSLFSIIPLPVSDIAIALTAIFGFSSIIFDYDILLIY